MEGEITPLAPVTAHLIATERGHHVAAAAVDRDLTSAQFAGHITGFVKVFGLHIGRQAVLRVVANIDGLIEAVIAQDRQHGAEDFFLGDGHLVGNIGKNGGLHIIALVQTFRTADAADDQGRALVDTGLDQLLDLVELNLGNHRTQLRIAVRIADRDGFSRSAGHGDRLIHTALRHQHTGRRIAGLTRIGHQGCHTTANALGEGTIV